MLTSAIESEDDRPTLDALLSALLTQLEPEPEGAAEGGDTERGDTERSDTERSAQPVWCRTHCHEVQLVTMRLLNVLMSRSKAGTKPSAEVITPSCWVQWGRRQQGGLLGSTGRALGVNRGGPRVYRGGS